MKKLIEVDGVSLNKSASKMELLLNHLLMCLVILLGIAVSVCLLLLS